MCSHEQKTYVPLAVFIQKGKGMPNMLYTGLQN